MVKTRYSPMRGIAFEEDGIISSMTRRKTVSDTSTEVHREIFSPPLEGRCMTDRTPKTMNKADRSLGGEKMSCGGKCVGTMPFGESPNTTSHTQLTQTSRQALQKAQRLDGATEEATMRLIYCCSAFLLLCLIPRACQAGNILVFPTEGSHWINMDILLQAVHSKGHNITILRSSKSWYVKDDNPYYNTITVKVEKSLDQKFITKIISDTIEFERGALPLVSFLHLTVGMMSTFIEAHEAVVEFVSAIFDDQELLRNLKDSKFDLLLTDPCWGGGVILAKYLNLPLVYNVRWLIPQEGHLAIAPSPLSYIPITGTGNTDKMSFFQRVKNVVLHLITLMQNHQVVKYTYQKVCDKHLGPDNDFNLLILSADIWLMRVDFVFEFPRPTMPNVVYIGGFQCKPAKPLPQHLEEFVQSSGEHGVIIMSLGTFVTELPADMTNVIAAAFAKLPQKVIWKYKGDRPATVGNNTLLVDWMPQNDLLGHPKIKLFVAHGGTNGVQEAIYHGVPVVGLPLFFDQYDNLLRLKERGGGQILTLQTVDKDNNFLNAIQEVLNEPSYRMNMQRLSRLHRDKPMQPLDTALFWIEFVMRHKGAAHLRTESYKLPWYSYHSVDVILFLLTVALLVFLFFVSSIWVCFRLCLKRKTCSFREDLRMILSLPCIISLLAVVIPAISGGKVLVFPHDGSHWVNMKVLVEELHSRGHAVTVIRAADSWYISETSPHYKTVTVDIAGGGDEDFYRAFVSETIQIKRSNGSMWAHFALARELKDKFSELHKRVCEMVVYMLENKELMRSFQDAKYDVVLTDPANGGGVFLAHYLGLPLVFNARWTVHGEAHFAIAPSPLSYVPLPPSELTDQMTFFERLRNICFYTMRMHLYKQVAGPHYSMLSNRYIGPDVDYFSLFQAADLWLMRVDFVFEFPRPTMPNVIYMGGFQCKPAKSLPQHLEEFVQSSGEHGVIIMSLGTLIGELPHDLANEIAAAFSKLPQKVIWRYKGDRPATVGNNTLLVDWMPQNDLLGHPSVKLFVSHGGTNGIYEAIYHGVPIVGIPIVFDQADNLSRLRAKGVAKVVDISALDRKIFQTAIDEVLNDLSFRMNMQRLSRLHRDQPMKPLDRALFWIEFVMRHKGAAHLRTESYKLPWYSYHSVDVLLFLLTVALLVFLFFVGIMNWPWVWILLCLLCPSVLYGGKVLVYPVDGSHWINMKVIIQELHSRGHQVSVIRSSDSWYIKETSSFYSSITIDIGSGFDEDFLTKFVAQLLQIQREGKSFWTRMKLEMEQGEKTSEMYGKMSKMLEQLFENKDLIQSLQEAKYDLVLTDPVAPGGTILAHYLKLPLVFNVRWTSENEGHFSIAPSPLSYVPMTGSELSDKMSFLDRLLNVAIYAFMKYQTFQYVMPHFDGVIEKYIGPDADYCSLFQAADLWLMRVDFVFEFPRPTMPNVIYMGGFQCKPAKPLPQHLEEFVQSSGEHGVIIMSLGTLIGELPHDLANEIAAAFSKLPQKVIWRYKGDRPATVGNNTLLVDWMPQNDLLGHPKIKLFVAHGGTNGVQEAIYHGVPILGLPLIFDQRDNLFRIEERGAGKIIDIFTMNEDIFFQGIQEVLTEPSYRMNMQRLSRLHRDQPMPPLDTALFWIEFVMRHKGAAHLRTESYKLPWYSYHSVDFNMGVLQIVSEKK
ncbi:hypothetical protein INR49_020248, partial [Caranx melampygus]